jgi:hypothetical protein
MSRKRLARGRSARANTRTILAAALATAAVIMIAGMVFRWYDSVPELYGDSDRVLMWETERRTSDGQFVSTHDAQSAAARVFEHTPLRGLTRAEVIKLLGDPQRSNNSIYNVPLYPADSSDGGHADVLVYRFDTGTHGWQFNVVFDEERVASVETLGIE